MRLYRLLVFPSFPDLTDSLNSHLIDHRALCSHEVEYCSGKRENSSDREGHDVDVSYDVNAEPYLKTDRQQGGNHTDAGLKEEYLEARDSCYMGDSQHDQESKIWHLFPV